MDNAELAFTIWGFASAVAVAALGAFTLAGGRSRPRGALAFGLFAVVWGFQIAAGLLANILSDPAAATTAYLGFLAFLLPLPYLLIEFAASQDARVRRPAWVGLRIGAALLGLGLATAVLLRPELLFLGVEDVGVRLLPRWGPLYAPLVILPFFAAFGALLWALWRASRNAATPRLATRANILIGGLGVYLAYTAGNNLVYFLQAGLLYSQRASDFLFVALFAGIATLSVVIAAEAWRHSRIASSREQGRRDAWLAAALTVPGMWGVAEAFLVFGPAPELNTVGLWRLGGVAVIAYGIARWRIYDLPQRATNAAASAAGASAALATGAAAYGVGTLAASSQAVPIAAGLLVLGAALFPAVQFARRFFGVDSDASRRGLEQSLYGQRIDAYRAALEASLARGTLDEDGSFLAALRERFHITPDEDRVLTHLAKSSVVVARDRHAWDAYERLRLLGEGGGGRTWLGRDRARDRLVVLKEPLERWQQEPGAREAVLREARLAAKVRHPNVVAVEEVVEASVERGADGRARPSSGKGSPVIVMEYLEGGSLAELLRAKGTLPWGEARSLMLDVLRGLEAVHANGIVHRDIKPSNILLGGDGQAKIADFGIAVRPGSSGSRTVVIDPSHSTIAGTLHYMAPEARLGADPDRRADVYGCAAVLHEMVYGAPPSLRSPTVVRHDLPAGVPALLARALAETPEARFPTARAFADELERLA